jgi:hypothetical protein
VMGSTERGDSAALCPSDWAVIAERSKEKWSRTVSQRERKRELTRQDVIPP